MKDVWNLDRIYKGFHDPAFGADMEALQDIVKGFNAFADKLEGMETLEGLQEGIAWEEKLVELGMKLATYAQLYAGQDFIMAAVHQENRLFAVELLGNTARASEILKAMGYETGIFRTPGSDTPFAMLYPLRESTSHPTYLGLAFD